MKVLLSISILLFFVTSCEVINPDEKIPSYVQIDSIGLLITDTLQGSASHSIVDAWVFVNDDDKGVFELPIIFPLLEKGTNRLEIKGGIKKNGISSDRVFYLLYDSYINKNFSLISGDTVKVNATVSYKSNTNFFWKEAFESDSNSLVPSSQNNVPIIRTTNPLEVKEGSGSAKLNLTATDTTLRIATKAMNLTKGIPVYLEMDYRINTSITIGLRSISTSQNTSTEISLLVLTPKVDATTHVSLPMSEQVWKKVYVEFTTEINDNFNSNADFYQVLISSDYNSVIGVDNTIYLDNLKVIELL